MAPQAHHQQQTSIFYHMMNTSWAENRIRIVLVFATCMCINLSVLLYLQKTSHADEIAERDRTIARLELQLNALALGGSPANNSVAALIAEDAEEGPAAAQ